MEYERMPRPGDIYNHYKGNLYQIITIATHTETNVQMVVYQALYGDFKTYVRPLASFISEVDHIKYPEVVQKFRFELRKSIDSNINLSSPGSLKKIVVEEAGAVEEKVKPSNEEQEAKFSYTEQDAEKKLPEGEVNMLLLKFLESDSYYKKLEIISSNRRHLNDRLINDMSVALDCTVEDGPLDDRIEGMINCLQALCRFENKRLR